MTEITKVREAASKILALRKLTLESGFITSRTQGQILQSLTADEVTAVAEILAKQPDAGR